MKKSALLVTSLIGVIIILTFVKVVLYNRLSTSGVFVSNVESEVNLYKTQNAILEEQLLNVSALKTISEKAEKLGFVKGSKVMVLKTSQQLAVKR